MKGFRWISQTCATTANYPYYIVSDSDVGLTH